MPYDFQWEVKAPEFKNDYSHQQSSDGKVTQGEYRVLLPDSRVQVVRFTVSILIPRNLSLFRQVPSLTLTLYKLLRGDT